MRSRLSLAVTLILGVACEAPPAVPTAPQSSLPPEAPVGKRQSAASAVLDAALAPTWPAPPAERFTVTTLEPVTGSDAQVQFECHRERRDVQRNHDDITYLRSANADLIPGTVLQGAPFAKGVLTRVPLRRNRACLYTDAPAAHPATCVETGDSASLQQAVSTLQREIDASSGPLTAQLSFQHDSTSSLEAMSVAASLNLSYAGPAVSAGLTTAFNTERSRSAVTVTAVLRQVLFTINLADDLYATATGFFAPDVTPEEMEAQVRAGIIGPTNLPVYVKTVSYGRVLVFTVTSTEVRSTDELRLAIRGAYLGFSGDASLASRYQAITQTASIRVLALGGSQEDALEAIRSGDFSLFFKPVRATNAVPISFRANYLGGSRPTASIGDALSFVEEDCAFKRPTQENQTQSWTFVVRENTGGRAPVRPGVDVQPGDSLTIAGSGQIWFGVAFTGCNGPSGWSGQAGSDFPMPGSAPFSLIARAGASGWHNVGARNVFPNVTWTGQLEVGTNDNTPGNGDNCGGPGFTVTVERKRAVTVWR